VLSPTNYLVTPPPAAVKRLTPRELEIVEMIAYHAATNLEICQETGTAEQTVKNQITIIFRKLGVVSRAQLTLYVFRGGAL
jgi:DNA-binding CsgD family transcriptional regulator